MSEYAVQFQDTRGLSGLMMAALAVSNAPALDAETPSSLRDVAGDVEMPVRAMRLSALAGSRCGTRNPASHILTMRDRFEMGGIYARADTTTVIEIESERDRADQFFIGVTMRCNKAACGSGKHASVTSGVLGTHPEPTRVGFNDLRPEAFFKGKMRSHREPSFLGVTVPDVSASRHPSILQGAAL